MSRLRSTTVIVAYQSRDRIDAALASQREAFEAGFSECVVVDNGSSDGTADHVAKTYPWVKLIRSENLGFGRGCNLGVSHSKTQYVLFLNPDAVLPFAELTKLVGFADEHPQAALLAPAIREPEGEWQHTGGLLSPSRLVLDAVGLHRLHSSERPLLPTDGAFRTNWLCAAILLARREAFEALSGFEPRYFMYFEETDLCRRALNAGFEIWAVGDAVGEHVNAASAKKSGRQLYDGCIAEHYFQSRFFYLQRHFGVTRATAAELIDLGCATLRGGLRLVRRQDLGELSVRLKAPVLKMPPPVPQ